MTIEGVALAGGFTYINDPLSVTFKCHGKLISVYPRKIAVNALRDDTEAEKILQWLKNEINDAWKRRNDITPSYKSVPRPNMLEILKILPRTNCQECGHPTCLVFSTLVAEGARGPDDCPPLDRQGKEKLEEYLGQFIFNL